MLSSGPRIVAVVPTYNERENVRPLVDGLGSTGLPNLTVLFVDDSSPDGTADEVNAIAREGGRVRLISRPKKAGIGSAYVTGFKEALSTMSAEVVVEMDADLQHPPGVLPRLVAEVLGGADVALASRYVKGGTVEGWGLVRRVVSKGANFYARRVLGLTARDCTSGYLAYSRGAAEKLASSDLPASGFEFQVAALLALKPNAKVVEVPFAFRSRVSGSSKLGFVDVIRFGANVTRMALR